MIDLFVQRWNDGKHVLRTRWRTNMPNEYSDIVRGVIEVISGDDDDDYNYYGQIPDPERITEIDHGDYQGTLLYVVSAKGYQPSSYWAVIVDYGSCSGCDTLQGVLYDIKDDEVRLDELMTLALHIVQRLKPITQDDDTAGRCQA